MQARALRELARQIELRIAEDPGVDMDVSAWAIQAARQCRLNDS